ncbi:MAG: OmpA family protein [Kiloniellaceae bacterium]
MLRKILMGGVAASFVVMSSGAANAVFLYGDEMDRARALPAQEQSFDGYLAREYRDFFLFEADQMYDWIDADHFAEKALAAADRQSVQPEDPANWDIDAAHMAELKTARGDLLSALTGGGREKAPEAAAIAQAKYDCWVEQQEEGHQPAHIAACKEEFGIALAKLQGALTVAEVAPEPAPVPETRMVIGEELAKAVLFFQFDKADVMQAEQAKIDSFVAQMKGLQDVVVFVEGHADRAGPSGYNVKLSDARAEAVRAALIREGITVGDLEELKTAAKGESEPAVVTPDGVPEQANRRVEIVARGMYAEEVPVSQ